MKLVGILALAIVAAVGIYLPLRYFAASTESNKELIAVRGELTRTKESLDVANRQLSDREKLVNELQASRAEHTKRIQQLETETNQARQSVKKLESDLAQARKSSEAQATPPPSPAEPLLVTCPYCGGDYKNKWVVCERKGGVGCDGKGYRPCFDCQGHGEKSCRNCNGTGKVVSESTSPGGGFTSRGERCTACNGRGKVDCTACGELYVRLPIEPFLEPIISQGNPLVSREIVYCGYHVIVAEHYGEWIRATGSIVCPKCSGKGKIKVKGPCPYCNEGKMEKGKAPWAVPVLQ